MQEAKFTATLKEGTGHDASWLVVRGDTVDEFIDALRACINNDLPGKVIMVADSYRTSPATHDEAVANVTRHSPGSQVTSDQRLPDSMSGPPCTTCGAPTEYKQGTSRAGKAYKGHFCTRSTDHKPQWI